MRSEEERLAARVTARTPRDDVAGEIDARLQPRVAHEAQHVLACLFVRVAVCNARDAALRIGAETGQFREVTIETVAIDSRRTGGERVSASRHQR